MEHMHIEMHEACKERFNEIDKRLDEGNKIFMKHTTDIAVLKTDMSNLIKSIGGLTKALWRVCSNAFTILVGFFIWYIQQL